jgi:hypothetical protein
MLIAINAMKNEVDAGIFLVLKGRVRTAWLHQQINKSYPT